MATIGQRINPTPDWSLRGGRWLAILALVGVASAALLALRLQPTPRYAVDLLQPLESLPFEIEGINAVEINLEGQPYRWTTDYPFIQIRNAYHLAPSFLATLTIRSERPDGPQPVTFLVNEQPLAIAQTTPQMRAYHLILPHRPDADSTLRFAAATKNFTPPNDLRRLGFITTSWSITPIFAGTPLGPITQGELALVLIGGLLLTAWLWLRAGRVTALSVGIPVALALLVLRGFYQPAPLPFSHLAMIALLATALLTLLTRQSWTALGLAIVGLITTFAGALWPSWMTDDALISFRYAQNLVAGNGLIYNLGERVEGYTNFLWTMLAALVLALGGDPVQVSYYAGIVIALLLIAATFVLARQLMGERWALMAAALLGTSHSLLIYTARGSGLETGLFALLLVIGTTLFLRERFNWAGAAFALATMTRPEGVLLLGIAGLVRLVAKRKIDAGIWRMVGVFALIGVPFFAWRFFYYGDLLPNTFYAKTGGGLPQALRGLAHAGSFALFAGGPVLALLLVLAAIRFVRDWRERSDQLIWQSFTWLVVGIYTAYIISVGGDHFPGYRFFVPVLPFLVLLMARGTQQIAAFGEQRNKETKEQRSTDLSPLLSQRERGGRDSDRGEGLLKNHGEGLPFLRRAAPAALAMLIVVGLSVFNLTRSTPFDQIVRGDDESVWLWREMGWWLADQGQPGESMAAMGAGAIPYYSDRETIDLLGLNDKHIARMEVEDMGSGVAGHEKQDPDYVLNERKPTYIPGIWTEYFGGSQALKNTGLYERQEVITRYGRRIVLWKRIA
ncbi:MAG: hypothetical protein JOZ51_26160 [Chloroflexi bacterium]|nr:hypothetical protein [Chloroflexota bacterium]